MSTACGSDGMSSAKHQIAHEDAERLAAETQRRMPEDYPAAVLNYAISVAVPQGPKTLAIYENETVGDAVAQFCQVHGMIYMPTAVGCVTRVVSPLGCRLAFAPFHAHLLY